MAANARESSTRLAAFHRRGPDFILTIDHTNIAKHSARCEAEARLSG
jgi:hypothetical protein